MKSSSYLTIRDRLARVTREVRERIYSTPGLTTDQHHAAYLHTLTTWSIEIGDVMRDLDARLREREIATGAAILPPSPEVFERGFPPEAFDSGIVDEDLEPEEEPEENAGTTPIVPAVTDDLVV